MVKSIFNSVKKRKKENLRFCVEKVCVALLCALSREPVAMLEKSTALTIQRNDFLANLKCGQTAWRKFRPTENSESIGEEVKQILIWHCLEVKWNRNQTKTQSIELKH